MRRSELDARLSEMKSIFVEVFDKLNRALSEKFYVSLVVEKRDKREFSVHPRGRDLQEKKTQGWVLRVFNGQTMIEQASDQFDRSKIFLAAEQILARAQSLPDGELTYAPPSWSQRLQAPLDEEIRVQIPSKVEASTWVHFGVPQKEVIPQDPSELMSYTQKVYEGWQEYMKTQAAELYPFDFSAVKMSFEKVDHLFIDSSVRMTQTLQRNSAMLVGLKKGKQTYAMKGGLGGLETLHVGDVEFEQTLARLRKILEAERIVPGRYKVLLSPSVTGVFAHEAFGHSQEADTWARGRSKARDLYRTHQRVGNDFANIVNNPAIYINAHEDFAAWGSYYFDEEGWFAEKQLLVEKGFLKEPMTNLSSALRLQVPRTANGKRENWSHGMYTRQTNTYFEPGTQTLSEIMQQIDYGFLATTPFGGMEDPKGMGIQVGMGFVEEIKNGQLTGRSFVGPNGGALQMTGYVPDYLNHILAVSKIDYLEPGPDVSLHPWNEVGGCGKYHKEVVVAGCGGPYMLIDQALLG